ncbi:MAG: polysaccharide deacetylase family protein [Candidatus Levybacteria bacterium]|nr:polysaccharide deacetylase family protein [Candidatus Levybacteria bacterium]
MPKKSKTSKKKKIIKVKRKSSFKFNPILFFIPIVISALFFGVFLFISSQFKQVVETPKTEVKKLPKEIKKEVFASSLATFRVPILLYHYIEYVQDKGDTIRQSLNINPYIFEHQIKTLSDAGYTFMTVSQLADVLDGKRELPKDPVLITIDDGHWDVYTDVLPILKKYNARATVYVISGFIGYGDFLSEDQLKKVIESGLVEIGSHTVHHVGLSGKFSPVVEHEVNESKKTLENNYHLKIVSFAYPGGSFDQKAIDIVKAAGYKIALSTIPGIEQTKENRFYLYRIRPGYRTGEELLKYLQQDKFRPW